MLSNVSFPQKSKYEAVSSQQAALARLAGLTRLDSLDSLDDSTSGLHSRTSPRAEDRREATRRRGGRAEQGASKEQARSKPSPAKYQSRRWPSPSPSPRFTTPEGCCVAAPSVQYLRLHVSIRLDQRSKKIVGASALDPCNGSTHTWRGRIIYHADLSGMNVRWCSTAGALGHGRMMMLSCLPLALVRQRKGCCHMSAKAAPT